MGFYPTDRTLVLLQSFTEVPTGSGDVRVPKSRATRLQVTGVYALTQAWSLQIGVYSTAWGRDALRERGFTTGVWWFF